MSPEELRLRQLFGNEMVHSTVMIRNDHEKIQPLIKFDNNVNNPEHTLWIKMMYYNYLNFAVIDEYLVTLRDDSNEYAITQ